MTNLQQLPNFNIEPTAETEYPYPVFGHLTLDQFLEFVEIAEEYEQESFS